MSEAATPLPGMGLPTTRPAVASRKARRPAGGARKVTRYTLDLDPQQHKFLRLWSLSNDVEASKCMRALLYLLEAGNELPAGHTLSDLVLDEIFGDDEPAEDTDETAEATPEAALEAALEADTDPSSTPTTPATPVSPVVPVNAVEAPTSEDGYATA